MKSWPKYDLSVDIAPDREDDADDYVTVFGKDVLETKPFVNVGAGDWRHPVWSNLDFVQPPYDKYTPPDYNINLSELTPLPIESGSVYHVFTSHTLEHLTPEMVDYWIKEIHRILAPGGIFRIVVPNIETAYWAYLLGDLRYYDHRNNARVKSEKAVFFSSQGFSKKQNGVARNFLARFASCLRNPSTLPDTNGNEVDAAQAVDDFFANMPAEKAYEAMLADSDFGRKRPSQHINWFTSDKLVAQLTEAGFDYAVRSSYGQSVSPLMRNKFYFDKTRPSESLYVEGIKAHPGIHIPS